MLDAKTRMVAKILGGHDAFSGFNAARFRPDLQGWNSDHPYLAQSIVEKKPQLVIEIGVWKGGSTIFMAQAMASNNISGAIIAVDTFLGSWDHYLNPNLRKDLLFQNGYPTLFNTFLTNVCEAEMQDYVIPLPLDSSNAANYLKNIGIKAQIIHIDAGHDYNAVMNDLQQWWPVLENGGIMIADDYDASGHVWPEVQKAVDDFCSNVGHEEFEAHPYKARFRKSA